MSENGMIGSAQEQAFIDQYRFGVLTTLRKSGQPVSSWVAYIREGDTLAISTPGATFKVSSIENDARVNLCMSSDEQPFDFVAVEGTAVVERAGIEATTNAILERVLDTGFQMPEDLAAWMAEQNRVILRITPSRVTSILRRH